MSLTLRRPSFGWLKPPVVPPDGVMTLAEHLKELRYRLIVSVIAIAAGIVVCIFFFNQLYSLLLHPYLVGAQILKEKRPNITTAPINTGFAAPFVLWMKVTAFAGLILACPVWIYELWAFVAPGLLAKEKRVVLGFMAAALPLFLLGVLMGYFMLPNGIAVLLAFTPDSVPVTAFVDVNNFLDTLMLTMLVFGVALLIPVVVVALNLVGVVQAAHLKAARRYIIFGCFVVGAFATPTGDPISMIGLAVPLMILMLAAEVFATVHDRRRAKRLADSPKVVVGS